MWFYSCLEVSIELSVCSPGLCVLGEIGLRSHHYIHDGAGCPHQALLTDTSKGIDEFAVAISAHATVLVIGHVFNFCVVPRISLIVVKFTLFRRFRHGCEVDFTIASFVQKLLEGDNQTEFWQLRRKATFLFCETNASSFTTVKSTAL